MNTRSCIGISTMKPCCRMLLSYKDSSIFGLSLPRFKNSVTCNNLSKLQSKSIHHNKSRCYTAKTRSHSHILAHNCVVSPNRRAFIFCDSSWGPYTVCSSRFRVHKGGSSSSRRRRRGVLVVPRVASNFRNHTTSIEGHISEKGFERIYIQGGFDRKPLVIEKIETGNNLVKEEGEGGRSIKVNIDYFKDLTETTTKVEREVSEIEKEAWNLLRGAIVNYCGNPVGTVAANNPADTQPLNYDQVFIRDFVPSALAFLLNGESDIVKNFLLHTLQLQSWEKTVDCYSPGQGLMPASFKVKTMPLDGNDQAFEEVMDPDFGESAIGRVAPVDSGLWWIILLRAYGKITGDYSLQERVDVQTGIRLILNLCLTDGFDMFPTLLVTDGSCMIDRRMGIHGHPLEIQALFYSALRCAREMMTVHDGTKNLVAAINSRLSALSFHVREYYWLDIKKINEIYRYNTEEYSADAINKFNIYPDQIPSWLVDWIPDEGGYLIGNLQPAHMDFRFFSLGNLWAIVCSLGTQKQNEEVLNLIEAKWDDFMGQMPLKICYPALEYEEWRIITGSDPKNTPWSYHNGGSWPTLLWQFTLACIKMGRPELAQKAISLAEKRLSSDQWPEYYDTRSGRFIGKQSQLFQTWTIAGFLTSKMLLENPEKAACCFGRKIMNCLRLVFVRLVRVVGGNVPVGVLDLRLGHDNRLPSCGTSLFSVNCSRS